MTSEVQGGREGGAGIYGHPVVSGIWGLLALICNWQETQAKSIIGFTSRWAHH